MNVARVLKAEEVLTMRESGVGGNKGFSKCASADSRVATLVVSCGMMHGMGVIQD